MLSQTQSVLHAGYREDTVLVSVLYVEHMYIGMMVEYLHVLSQSKHC